MTTRNKDRLDGTDRWTSKGYGIKMGPMTEEQKAEIAKINKELDERRLKEEQQRQLDNIPISDPFPPLETYKQPRHSGFEAPAIGVVMPKGTKVKHNPDGTITLIPPDDPNSGK